MGETLSLSSPFPPPPPLSPAQVPLHTNQFHYNACRIQPTLPAICRVTVHEHPGGICTAVDLRDGCFGSTTIMRIVSMFVPHNIFQEMKLSSRTKPKGPTESSIEEGMVRRNQSDTAGVSAITSGTHDDSNAGELSFENHHPPPVAVPGSPASTQDDSATVQEIVQHLTASGASVDPEAPRTPPSTSPRTAPTSIDEDSTSAPAIDTSREPPLPSNPTVSAEPSLNSYEPPQGRERLTRQRFSPGEEKLEGEVEIKVKAIDQVSIHIHNCRTLGPGLQQLLAKPGTPGLEDDVQTTSKESLSAAAVRCNHHS